MGTPRAIVQMQSVLVTELIQERLHETSLSLLKHQGVTIACPIGDRNRVRPLSHQIGNVLKFITPGGIKPPEI